MAVTLLAATLGMSAQEMRKDSLSFMSRFQEGLKIIKDGDYSKARDIFNELLPYADSAMTDRLAYNIGRTWHKQYESELKKGEYSKAENSLEIAVDYFERAGTRAETVSSLDALSVIRSVIGDVDGALDGLAKAERMLDPSMGRLHVNILKRRSSIDDIFDIDALTNPLISKVDSLLRTSTDYYVKYQCIEILADKAVRAGKLSQAVGFYREALGYLDKEEMKPEDKLEKRERLVRLLRSTYLAMNRFHEALEYGKEAVSLSNKSTYTAKDFGMNYYYVAEVYAAMKDTANCLVYVDSLLINGGKPLVEPWKRTRHLKFAGIIYGKLGCWDQAIQYYDMADSVSLANKGKGFEIERVDLAAFRARALYRAHRLEESKQAYKEYYEGCRKVYGEDYDRTTLALRDLANIYAYSGDPEQGVRCLVDAEEHMARRIRERLRFLPSSARKGNLNVFVYHTLQMTPFVLKTGHLCDEVTARSWDALLLSKSLLLASDISTFKIIKRYGTPDDRTLYDEVISLQQQLSLMESKGMANTDKAMETYRRLMFADSELARHCTAYGNVSDFLNIKASVIQSALADNDVVVDMTDFIANGIPTYCAYIVRKGDRYPQLVRLYEKIEDKTDTRLSEDDVKAFLKNLAAELHPGENVFFVPSGNLHTFPIEAVTMPDGSLFGEEYNVFRLSSARDVLNFKGGKSLDRKRLTASLFGNIYYGVDSDYSALTASASELRDIAKAIRRKAVIREYSGSDGTVEAFLSLDGNSTDIIHVATHGFYYEPKANENRSNAYMTAMNMSGLVMADGKKLTATDIAALDLSGTSLVCLSACETGLGHVTPEGIYGLQRAFKKAGVRHILVNVGEASDVASSLFMTEFYRALVRNGYDAHDAFRKAQEKLRKRYPDPYYWAGFLLLD